jgi:hypothetical protein
MAISYTSKSTAVLADGLVYEDTPLWPELAVAAREKATEDQGAAKPLVFQVKELKELESLVPVLSTLKTKGQVPISQIAPPLAQAMIRQGYINYQGQPQGDFLARLKASPRLELIAGLGNGHHAALSMSEQGAVYIDSKAAEMPNVPVRAGAQQGVLPQLLSSFWLQFYDKNIPDPQKQAYLARHVHFKTKIEQQPASDNYSSIDYCLLNLDTLNQDTAMSPASLEAKKKPLPRNQIIRFVQETPDYRKDNASSTPLEIRYTAKKQEQEKHNAWSQEVCQVEAHHGRLYQERDAGREGDWIKLYCNKPAPKYRADSDNFNRYTTTQDDVVNTFDLKEDGLEVVSSGGGALTYSARFLRIAKDMFAAYVNEAGRLAGVITIRKIEPPEQIDACKKAFEAVFGPDCVAFPEADEDGADDSIVARLGQ